LILEPANVFSLENFSKILTNENKKEYFVKKSLIFANKNLPKLRGKQIFRKLLAEFKIL
jgi:hypothetical protein